MESILEISGVGKKYESSDFGLKDISFSVPYGVVMGLIGENGSGKTTLINTILNILTKDSGTIKLFGQEMTDKDTQLRQRLGVVFDRNNFPSRLNARRLSKVMTGIYTNWDNNKFQELCTRFQLPDNRSFETFSRGMSMKLSLASALSHHPDLLILDEATNGLDPAVRDEMTEVFLEFLENDRHSILFSTHITDDLEKIADHITFLHHGEILLAADKDDLLYNYAIMRCKKEQFPLIDSSDYLAYRPRDYQIDLLITDKKLCKEKYKDVIIDNAFIDEIMLIMIKGER